VSTPSAGTQSVSTCCSTRGYPVMPEPPAPSKFGTVKVAEGDTLYRIAKRVYGDGSRWSEIATLNNLSDGKALKPGRELKYALAR